jgi:endonuclease/exonuclease/phosphatase (EEP) superfamily protein YafD
MLFIWGIQTGLGDRWWPATFLLYGPRWIWAAPLALLVPAAIGFNRRALIPTLLGAVVVLFPIMGLCVPWRAALARGGSGKAIRVLTCNVQGRSLDAGALADLIEIERPDIVALQEWDDDYCEAVFRAPGWNVGVYRGICVASRHPVEAGEVLGPKLLGTTAFLVRCRVKTPAGEVVLHDIHLETPRQGIEAVLRDPSGGVPTLQANTALRLSVSEIAGRLVGDPAEPASLVVGDFNLPGDSPIFRRTWSRYHDAFAEAGWGFGSTKFTRWFGARIDHILSGPAWRPRRCRVGPYVGSDHRPLLADLDAAP